MCRFDSDHRHQARVAVRRTGDAPRSPPSHPSPAPRGKGQECDILAAMKFCSTCGHSVVTKIFEGDHLPRFVCEACGAIHYQNPRIIAGCIPEWQGKILLCRRAIEPRRGFWTVPAGFMENGEAVQDAAAREAQE